MPNRIIKESICTSESIDGLSWFEEVFFYRLVVNCDDFGRFDARAAVLKSRLFPLKNRITLKDVSSALTKLAKTGIVRLYECDGKPYLYLPTWESHQTPRAKKSKFPAPEEPVKSSESICMQMQANAPGMRYSVSDIRDTGDSAEPPNASTPPAILLPLNDGTQYPVSDAQCREWETLYPAVDVPQQLRSMKGWLDANPQKRKTGRGILRFINSWLAREQDRGRSPEPVKQKAGGEWNRLDG